jgi:CHAT domain-containing protein/Flp pilus assembly protein TadD
MTVERIRFAVWVLIVSMAFDLGIRAKATAAVVTRATVKVLVKSAHRSVGRLKVGTAVTREVFLFRSPPILKVLDRLPDVGERTHCPEIEELFLRAQFWEKMVDSAPAVYVGDCFALQGRYNEAEAVYRRALAVEERGQKVRGVNIPGRGAANLLSKLGILLDAEGRAAEAEPLFRRTLGIEELFGADSTETATALNNLAISLHDQGHDLDAEPLLRRALLIREKSLGPDDRETANSLDALGVLLLNRGDYAQAESMFRRSAEINERTAGEGAGATATSLSNLGYCLFLQHQYQQASPFFQRALAIRSVVLRPDHPDTLSLRENIARNLAAQGELSQAVAEFRVACASQSSMGSGHNVAGDAAQAIRRRISQCSTDLSLLLWAWASSGGGKAMGDQPAELMKEAFLISQRAVRSTAADAVARAASISAAKSAGILDQALSYEAALFDRQSIDWQFATLEGQAGKNPIESRQALEMAHDELSKQLQDLETEIRRTSPRYWEFRNPTPVSLRDLQANVSDGAGLLHDEEALLTFLVPPGETQGLVFAVSRSDMAWSAITMSGAQLKACIARLRSQLDPHGYELRAAGSAKISGDASHEDYRSFNRQLSYELYQALLGDVNIQRVIKDKAVLLFAADGPLSSLPPGLLIASPPKGGAVKDADPETLRESDWLLRSKAVALIPSVSSLITLRRLMPTKTASTVDPLLAFADPELPGEPANKDAIETANGEMTLAKALASLPPLPGTRFEVESLRRAVDANPASVLEGKDATKAALMTRDLDGRLAKVRILEFATHGLMAGDVTALTEPALVLGSGKTPEDDLLLASEAAGLNINADWVLLSACNTASPAAETADGLSGLTRSFLYAGGRALLVSHWRIRDDVASVLVPYVVMSQQKEPSLSNVQALRQASLAILDDVTLDAANPRDWAPFTLVGEATR